MHFSLQRDHVQLLVEAASQRDLACGMKSIGPRLARAVHRAFRRRRPVLSDRYNLHVLRTPREVRNALAYVLLNARKHWRERNGVAPPVRIDAASPGCWFGGWKWRAPGNPETLGPPEVAPAVAPARTWLLAVGWRRHGLVDPTEVPGS